MDDKKFVVWLSVFAVISFALVLGLGAVVLLDAKGHKDPSKQHYSGIGATAHESPSLLDRP